MMRYQRIESRIWFDEKFKELTWQQQRIFLYILANPHGNLMGLFFLPFGYIIEDLKSLNKDLAKPSDKEAERLRLDFLKIVENGLVEYDEKTCVIWVKKLLKHNPITNPNQIKASIKCFKELPKSQLLHDFVSKCQYLPEALAEGLRKVLSEVVAERLLKPEDRRQKTEDRKKSGSSEPSPSTSAEVSGRESQEQENDNGKSKVPNCPTQEIVKRWHTLLPNFAEVKFIDKTTRANVRNRWAEDPDRWSVDWWDDFFKYIGESDFLSGRKTDFKASFPWVMGPKNFSKIINGQYNNNRALPRRTQTTMASADAVKRMIQEGRI